MKRLLFCFYLVYAFFVSCAAAAEADEDGFYVAELSGAISAATLKYKVNLQDPDAGGVDTITVSLTVPATAWLSVASTSSGVMVGSEAIIGLPGSGTVKKYNLNAKNANGVVEMPENQQTLINSNVAQTTVGETTLTYTKILVENGEIEIDGNGIGNGIGFYGR